MFKVEFFLQQEKWIHTYRLLIDERGPWSANPFPNSVVARWKLDKSEDGWRRRQKLRRNYHFDDKLCRPSATIPSNGALPSTSDSSILGFGALTMEKMKQFSPKGIRRITEEGSSEPSENEAQSSHQEIEDSSGATKESSEHEIVKDREEKNPLVTESENSEV